MLLGDTNEFKSKYPSAAGSGWLRNLFILQFILWADEFEDIIFPMWDKKDYTYLFPTVNPYPMQLGMYITRMITSLRELEGKLGSADHKVHSTNKDMERGSKKEEQKRVVKNGDEKGAKVKTIKTTQDTGSDRAQANVRQRYVAGDNNSKDEENV